MAFIWIVYTQQGSVTVLQATGSLLLQILLSLCYLIIVSVPSCLSFEGKQVYCEKSSPGSLYRRVPYSENRCCTVTVYIASGAMTSGDSGISRPRVDHRGVTFCNKLQTAWNAPESYVTFDSQGVVELDTLVVSDVLGLWVRYQNAGLTRVLPRRDQNSVCVLVPDARAVPRGFHDVTLVNMAGETGPEVPMEDMYNLDMYNDSGLHLRWQGCHDDIPTWSHSGESARTGSAILMLGESPIVDETLFMTWHATYQIITYYVDLAQLWRCPVSWCTQWKGTSQDCIDHINSRHHVGVTVKTANLGKWFPPWTVTQAALNTVVKSNVSGISTDVVLFSEHGAQLVHHYRVFGIVSPMPHCMGRL